MASNNLKRGVDLALPQTHVVVPASKRTAAGVMKMHAAMVAAAEELVDPCMDGDRRRR
jgi:hypothetical protein